MPITVGRLSLIKTSKLHTHDSSPHRCIPHNILSINDPLSKAYLTSAFLYLYLMQLASEEQNQDYIVGVLGYWGWMSSHRPRRQNP